MHPVMTSVHRSRREAKFYTAYQRNLSNEGNPCEFCDINDDDPKFIQDTEHFKVIRNLVPYTFWDDHTVQEHLLVIPKFHTDTLSDINPEWAAEFLGLVSDYERRGYSVYARPPKAHTKSVPHQHTHLIKITANTAKLLVYARKPNIRIVK